MITGPLIWTIPAAADFEKTKIAVLDFQLQGSGHGEDDGKIVAEWLITAFVKEGRFEVIERSLLEKIIEEQKLAMSGIVDTSSAIELGKLLGVKAIISGSLMRFQNILEVNARIIDVQDASIIAAESVKSNTATRLGDLVVQMADKIIKNFPLEGYVVDADDQKVTIDLGKETGVKKGMNFSVFKEGKVIKHPKTGQVLDIQRIQTGVLEITSVSNKIAMGKIVSTTDAGPVRYGQMVKSISGASATAAILSSYAQPEPPKKPARTSRKPSPEPEPEKKKPPIKKADIPVDLNNVITALTSGNAAQVRKAARLIHDKKLFDANTLKVVEAVLLQGYDQKYEDRYHADAMAWLCNVLGSAKNKEYLDTLKTVTRGTRSRKIKGYAAKNYNILRRIR